MRPSRVVAWLPADPSVRVMARATAESALRGADLRLLSPAPPPRQWSAWRAAAESLGVKGRWHVVTLGPHEEVLDALRAEAACAALVVTDATSLNAAARSQLAQGVDVYVVASARAGTGTRLREPAVVVGVPDSPDSAHLLSTARHEAMLRLRHLIILHAQSRAVDMSGHLLERRWLDAERFDPTGSSRPPSRVVVTRRPVTNALRDHVEPEDVLVVGVHAPRWDQPLSLDTSLLETPPCDLLLTRTAGAPSGSGATPAPHVLEMAVSSDPNLSV